MNQTKTRPFACHWWMSDLFLKRLTTTEAVLGCALSDNLQPESRIFLLFVFVILSLDSYLPRPFDASAKIKITFYVYVEPRICFSEKKLLPVCAFLILLLAFNTSISVRSIGINSIYLWLKKKKEKKLNQYQNNTRTSKNYTRTCNNILVFV